MAAFHGMSRSQGILMIGSLNNTNLYFLPWPVLISLTETINYCGISRKTVSSLSTHCSVFSMVTISIVPRTFPSKIIWNFGATPRISFFAWEAAKEKILTLENLMKRGHTTANRCFLCKNALEYFNHLLLSCPIVHKLWSMILGLLGTSWVMAGNVCAELIAWEGLGSNNKSIRLILLTIFWVIWKKKKQNHR